MVMPDLRYVMPDLIGHLPERSDPGGPGDTAPGDRI